MGNNLSPPDMYCVQVSLMFIAVLKRINSKLYNSNVVLYLRFMYLQYNASNPVFVIIFLRLTVIALKKFSL